MVLQWLHPCHHPLQMHGDLTDKSIVFCTDHTFISIHAGVMIEAADSKMVFLWSNQPDINPPKGTLMIPIIHDMKANHALFFHLLQPFG